MSSDNEYVALLKYEIHLNVDLSMFITLWAVLYYLMHYLQISQIGRPPP